MAEDGRGQAWKSTETKCFTMLQKQKSDIVYRDVDFVPLEYMRNVLIYLDAKPVK